MDTETVIGILVVDKPGGVTSHDVVDRIRRRFGIRKVGHLGTLDPMATGVLPITIGKATRLARFIPGSPKEYTGRIRLGQDTTTCDAEGEPAGEERPVTLESVDIAGAMAGFLGRVTQVPPAYSAKKVGGVRAHRLARKGIPVEIEAVEVEIELFELAGWNPPDVEFRVVCSPGTYVRSLARDLGAKLDTGGHLRALRRVRSGPFTLEGALGPDAAGTENVRPPEQVLARMPGIHVDEAGEDAIRHGRPVPCPPDADGAGDGLCIFNKRGKLIAVAKPNRGWADPQVVLL